MVGGNGQKEPEPVANWWVNITLTHCTLAFSVSLWVSFGMVAFMSGLVVEGPDGTGGLSVVQSIYLMTQLVSTIGYGDLVPKHKFGMVCCTIYILFSSLFISAVVTTLVDSVVRKQQAEAASVIEDFFDDGDPHNESFLEKHRRIVMAAIGFATCLLLWAVFYAYVCDPFFDEEAERYTNGNQKCEDRGLVEAFYMGTATLTTLGLGDIVPRTNVGQIVFIPAVFVGIAAYVNLVGAITQELMRRQQKARVDHINMSDFEAADLSGDGKVDLFEFSSYILKRYDLVQRDVLEEIRQNFEELDVDGSGFLTAADIEKLVFNHGQKHRHARGDGYGLPERPDDAQNKALKEPLPLKCPSWGGP